MNYEKLTPVKFSENLVSGRYANATGARRAIGKADWTDKDKDKARATVDAHFGGDVAPTKATTKTPVRAGTKKTAKTKAVEVAPENQSDQDVEPQLTLPFSETQRLEICDRAITTTAQSLTAIGSITSASGINFAEVQKVVDGLIHLVDIYHTIAEKLLGEERTKAALEANGVTETSEVEAEKRTGSLFSPSFS